MVWFTCQSELPLETWWKDKKMPRKDNNSNLCNLETLETLGHAFFFVHQWRGVNKGAMYVQARRLSTTIEYVV